MGIQRLSGSSGADVAEPLDRQRGMSEACHLGELPVAPLGRPWAGTAGAGNGVRTGLASHREVLLSYL